MDAVDRKILAWLQDDGRMSLTQLASDVGLSVSAAHRRLKDLEAGGAITRYRAVVDAAKVGLGFEALVFVTMSRTDAATIARFEEAVVAVPRIVTAERLFGDPDYLLHVLSADLGDYQALYDSTLAALPGVQRVASTIVMKHLVAERGVPLD
jgi:DNA-binding Lrp family transcriptional regulator